MQTCETHDPRNELFYMRYIQDAGHGFDNASVAGIKQPWSPGAQSLDVQKNSDSTWRHMSLFLSRPSTNQSNTALYSVPA
jgi:hypothetical protein